MFYRHSFRQVLNSILRHKKCKSKAFKRFSGHSALLKEGERKSFLVDGGPTISRLLACSTATAGSLQAAAFPVEYLSSGLAGLAGMDGAGKGSISIRNGLDALEATVATSMAKRTMLEMLAAGGGSLADDDGMVRSSSAIFPNKEMNSTLFHLLEDLVENQVFASNKIEFKNQVFSSVVAAASEHQTRGEKAAFQETLKGILVEFMTLLGQERDALKWCRLPFCAKRPITKHAKLYFKYERKKKAAEDAADRDSQTGDRDLASMASSAIMDAAPFIGFCSDSCWRENNKLIDDLIVMIKDWIRQDAHDPLQGHVTSFPAPASVPTKPSLSVKNFKSVDTLLESMLQLNTGTSIPEHSPVTASTSPSLPLPSIPKAGSSEYERMSLDFLVASVEKMMHADKPIIVSTLPAPPISIQETQDIKPPFAKTETKLTSDELATKSILKKPPATSQDNEKTRKSVQFTPDTKPPPPTSSTRDSAASASSIVMNLEVIERELEDSDASVVEEEAEEEEEETEGPLSTLHTHSDQSQKKKTKKKNVKVNVNGNRGGVSMTFMPATEETRHIFEARRSDPSELVKSLQIQEHDVGFSTSDDDADVDLEDDVVIGEGDDIESSLYEKQKEDSESTDCEQDSMISSSDLDIELDAPVAPSLSLFGKVWTLLNEICTRQVNVHCQALRSKNGGSGDGDVGIGASRRGEVVYQVFCKKVSTPILNVIKEYAPKQVSSRLSKSAVLEQVEELCEKLYLDKKRGLQVTVGDEQDKGIVEIVALVICHVIWGSEFQKFEETNAVWYDAFLLDINRRVGGGYAGGRGEIEPAHVDIFSDLLLTGKM